MTDEPKNISDLPQPPTQGVKRALKLILGLAISAVIFYFIFKKLSGSWSEIGETLLTGNLLYLALSFIVLFISFPVPFLIWRRIVNDLYDHQVGLKFTFVAMMLANISRYIPGKVWFVAIMAWMAGEYKVSKERFVVSSILTQLFNLMAAALIGVALTRGGQIEVPLWTLTIIAVALAIVLRPKFLHKATIWTLRLKHAKGDVPTMPFKTVLYAICLQFLALGLMGTSMFLMAKAFDPNLSLKTLPHTIGSSSLSYFLGYVSFLTPAGLGVREGSIILLLPVEISETVRATVSIGFRIWSILVEITHTIIALVFYAKLSKELK